jgi:ABC-2 type transport system permease protein
MRSWWALMVREYLEHRAPFLYVPAGIVALMVLSATASLGFNRVQVLMGNLTPTAIKVFEIGYFALLALWFAYLVVTLFFYFGDAFSADRRNNAMFFWKSMPVTDLKMVASKFFAGILLFPAIILIVAAVTGLIFYGIVNVAAVVIPGILAPSPIVTLQSFGQITLFALVDLFFAVLWYAPFLAWVGGLSTIFGRWSLPLAFVIPGLISVVENMVFFGSVPRGGYVWSYLARRWQFGLNEIDYGAIAVEPTPFGATVFIERLMHQIDWTAMGEGLVFAAVVLYLASEYRRRRIN